MRFNKLCFGLLMAVAANAESLAPMGWATGTVGGEGGVEYHVNSFKELREAMNNNGKPNEPKIIYIDSPINGNEDEEGNIRNAEHYVPGYSLEKYLKCFTEDGLQWLDTEDCNKIEELRLKGMPLQKESIALNVTPKTTIIGTGNDSILEQMSIQIVNSEQVIIKDLAVEAPIDLFPQWDPTDGVKGSWNSEYDAIVVDNSTYVWVDNCLLSDGKHTINTTPKTFGKYIELHDGLLDVINSSNYVSISNNRFENHQKTSLIGNSDKLITDADHLKVTIYNNVFYNCNERLPRVRFGKVHVFNNYYYASTFDDDYPSLTVNSYYHDDSVFPSYFIGLGLDSDVRSEYNYFVYEGNDKIPDDSDIIVYSYGGHIFKDTGSLYNGEDVELTILAEMSFNLKVENRLATDLAKNKTSPAWTKASFTSEAFNPSDYYDYELVTDMKKVADLVNTVPTWLYGSSEKPSNTTTEVPAATTTTQVPVTTITITTTAAVPTATEIPSEAPSDVDSDDEDFMTEGVEGSDVEAEVTEDLDDAEDSEADVDAAETDADVDATETDADAEVEATEALDDEEVQSEAEETVAATEPKEPTRRRCHIKKN